MKRTKVLRLQQPESGDVYNDSTITSNTALIDKMMANLGGQVEVKEIPIESVITLRSGYSYNTDYKGTFKIFGNGLAYIEVVFKKNASLEINNIGMLGVPNNSESTSNVVVADVKPEYAPALAQPLTSGGYGPAIHGYIAPDTPRVVARQMLGYYSGSVPANTVMQLTGIYPLTEVPKTARLEQMTRLFDSELHKRNLMVVDSIANKVKAKDKFLNIGSKIKPKAGTTNLNVVAYRVSNGAHELRIIFDRTSFTPTSSGDIANTDVAYIDDPAYYPSTNVKLVSVGVGKVFQGELSRDGVISITSYSGKNVANSSSTGISLAGSWFIQ